MALIQFNTCADTDLSENSPSVSNDSAMYEEASCLVLNKSVNQSRVPAECTDDIDKLQQILSDLIDARLIESSGNSHRLFTSVANYLKCGECAELIVGTLFKTLKDSTANYRLHCNRLLASVPNLTAQYIPEMIQDIDENVRLYTLDIMQELPHPNVPAWLNQLLANENNVNVIVSAINCCLECGSSDSVVEIDAIREKFSNVSVVQFAANLAKERLGGPGHDQ